MLKDKIKTVFDNFLGLAYMPHALIYGLLSDNLKAQISLDVIANTPRLQILNKHLSSSDEIFIVDRRRLSISLSQNPYLRTLYFHRLRKFGIIKLLWGRKSKLEIPYDVEIGPGVALDHPFSTIINAKRIGSNLRIKNNVTIGNKNDDENLRPVFGDNVYIGAGAIVIGDIKIGNNVIVGAGTVVTKSLPDNCTVVGNPAKILSASSTKKGSI